jgi:SMODS and SLOG-associating 2TM effector domain 2
MASPPIDLSKLSWKDADIENSLSVLHQYAEDQAQKQNQWYWDKKRAKAHMSMFLRFVAIILFALGGLVPIVKATLPATVVAKFPFDFGQSGYLLIGVAAGCIGLDRFFGYSTGWIRYITTAMAIEKSLEEFRLEWTRNMAKMRGTPATPEQLETLIQTCAAFCLAIKSQVEQETKAWVVEFQTNLSQLEKDLQAKADEAKAKTKAAAAGGMQ